MKAKYAVTIGVLAGVALGGTAVRGLGAQANPPAYVVIDIAEISDAEGFKAVPSSTAPMARTMALGGHYVIRSNAATALDGKPPARLVMIAFDSKEKAQAWYDSPDVKPLTAIRGRTTKSAAFIVEGVVN